jgi:hypothetical protein
MTTAKTTARLNLRAGPSTNDTVRTVIPSGAVVTLTGTIYDVWYAVTYNGLAGWVSGTYLTDFRGTASPAKVTRLQALDNLFSHYNEPYIWDINDCSQFVVNRWRDWGFAPEPNFVDASSDRMYDAFRTGAWAGTKQDMANPAPLSLIFYTYPGEPNTARHVQFVLLPGVGLGQNGGNKATTTPAIAKQRDARSKVAPLNYRVTEGYYVVGGIWLPDYRFPAES